MVHWKRTSYNSMDLVLPHFAGSGGSSSAFASRLIRYGAGIARLMPPTCMKLEDAQLVCDHRLRDPRLSLKGSAGLERLSTTASDWEQIVMSIDFFACIIDHGCT
jgi:hypothetical protein